MDLDTATLRALAVLAEELNFGRAAHRLQITQQAMSKRIQRLEALTGGAVVDRTERRVVRLTAHGVRLAAAARDVLAAVDRLPSLADDRAGRLRVDVLDENLAPMGWVRRAARSPGVAPIDVLSRSHDLSPHSLVRSGQADVAFGRAGAVSSPWPAGLSRRLVLLEPLSLLVPSTHPWAARSELPLAELRGHTWWFPMTQAPHEWRDLVAELSRYAGLTLEVTGSTFGYQQWAADVTAGAAPPSILGEEMLPPPGLDLTTVPIVDPTPVFPWWLLWDDRRSPTDVDALLVALGFGGAGARPVGDVWLPEADAALLGQPPGASSSR